MKKWYFITLFLMIIFPSFVNAKEWVYKCDYKIFVMEDIETPLTVTVYDDDSVSFESNGKALNNKNNFGVKFSNDNEYTVGLPSSSEFLENVKNNGNYKCPSMFSVYESLAMVLDVHVGDGGDYAAGNQFQARIVSGTPNSNSQTPVKEITVNQECVRKTRTNINKRNINIDFYFKIYTDGTKEVCADNVDIGQLCSKDGFLSITIDGLQLQIDIVTEEIFKQNFAMLEHNSFACPDTVYFALSQYPIDSGAYTALLTTNKEEAEKFGKTTEVVENPGNSNDDKYNPGTEVTGCEVVPKEVRKWIGISLNFIKYIALILVIVLGTIDFIKAAGSGEPDTMKKAGQSFIKRVIAVIILFLLPMIIDLILHLINLYGSTDDCFNVLG